MIYKITNGIPTPANLRADFPNTSFPADLSKASLPYGYIWARPTDPPSCGYYERTEQSAPVQVEDYTWRQGWKIVPWAPEKIHRHLVDSIQGHLDAIAQSRAYDGILSLCTYATSPSPKFAAEGQAGVEWRDACWAKGYEILAEYRKGLRQIPMPDELIAELPAIVWPE